MKTGQTLDALAAEVLRQRDLKRDFVASASALSMNAAGTHLTLKGVDDFGIQKLAHRQLSEFTGIPAKYYDVMQERAPDLLAANVNRWLTDHNGTKRMVRTLDGQVRAFVSEKYRPLENAELIEAVVPPIMQMGLTIMSCQLTETRLYLKAVDPRIERDIPKGGGKMGDGGHTIFDTVSPGIVISNSEVGLGMLSIETGVWTRACTNMAIFAQRSMRKYHVGGKSDLSEGITELLSDKTKRITDAAVWSQAADVVRGAFDQARFDAALEEVRGMSEQKITGDVPSVVEVAAKQLGLADGERRSVLQHLIEGGDLSRYGLFNAITRTAEDLDDYDRATQFERLGGQIIELPANDWKRIAEAA